MQLENKKDIQKYDMQPKKKERKDERKKVEIGKFKKVEIMKS